MKKATPLEGLHEAVSSIICNLVSVNKDTQTARGFMVQQGECAASTICVLFGISEQTVVLLRAVRSTFEVHTLCNLVSVNKDTQTARGFMV